MKRIVILLSCMIGQLCWASLPIVKDSDDQQSPPAARVLKPATKRAPKKTAPQPPYKAPAPPKLNPQDLAPEESCLNNTFEDADTLEVDMSAFDEVESSASETPSFPSNRDQGLPLNAIIEALKGLEPEAIAQILQSIRLRQDQEVLLKEETYRDEGPAMADEDGPVSSLLADLYTASQVDDTTAPQNNDSELANSLRIKSQRILASVSLDSKQLDVLMQDLKKNEVQERAVSKLDKLLGVSQDERDRVSREHTSTFSNSTEQSTSGTSPRMTPIRMRGATFTARNSKDSADRKSPLSISGRLEKRKSPRFDKKENGDSAGAYSSQANASSARVSQPGEDRESSRRMNLITNLKSSLRIKKKSPRGSEESHDTNAIEDAPRSQTAPATQHLKPRSQGSFSAPASPSSHRKKLPQDDARLKSRSSEKGGTSSSVLPVKSPQSIVRGIHLPSTPIPQSQRPPSPRPRNPRSKALVRNRSSSLGSLNSPPQPINVNSLTIESQRSPSPRQRSPRSSDQSVATGRVSSRPSPKTSPRPSLRENEK